MATSSRSPGAKLNGKLTLGENTADNGGLRIAYQALMSVLASEGAIGAARRLTAIRQQQRFFISFAQVWCQNATDQIARVSASKPILIRRDNGG